MTDDNGTPKVKKTMRGGRHDGRSRNPGSGLTVTPAEKILLRGIRDARRRLLRSGNQFDINVAEELKRVTDAWGELTGLAFPSDEALDKEDETWTTLAGETIRSSKTK